MFAIHSLPDSESLREVVLLFLDSPPPYFFFIFALAAPQLSPQQTELLNIAFYGTRGIFFLRVLFVFRMEKENVTRRTEIGKEEEIGATKRARTY